MAAIYSQYLDAFCKLLERIQYGTVPADEKDAEPNFRRHSNDPACEPKLAFRYRYFVDQDGSDFAHELSAPAATFDTQTVDTSSHSTGNGYVSNVDIVLQPSNSSTNAFVNATLRESPQEHSTILLDASDIDTLGQASAVIAGSVQRAALRSAETCSFAVAPSCPRNQATDKSIDLVDHHTCKRCKKSYTEAKPLYRHMRSAHKGHTYTCSLCHLSLSRRDALTRHIQEQHQANDNARGRNNCRGPCGGEQCAGGCRLDVKRTRNAGASQAVQTAPTDKGPFAGLTFGVPALPHVHPLNVVLMLVNFAFTALGATYGWTNNRIRIIQVGDLSQS